MDKMISLSVGTAGSNEFFNAYEKVNKLAVILADQHSYVSVTSHVVDEHDDEEDSSCDREHLYHDQHTLQKVRQTLLLSVSGLTEESVDHVMSNLLNAGILFRESLDSKGAVFDVKPIGSTSTAD